jgi:hypothetical protein
MNRAILIEFVAITPVERMLNPDRKDARIGESGN